MTRLCVGAPRRTGPRIDAHPRRRLRRHDSTPTSPHSCSFYTWSRQGRKKGVVWMQTYKFFNQYYVRLPRASWVSTNPLSNNSRAGAPTLDYDDKLPQSTPDALAGTGPRAPNYDDKSTAQPCDRCTRRILVLVRTPALGNEGAPT